MFFPHILFVGLGIGTANFLMNGQLNWIQWIIQSLSTSFIIGYTLVLIGLNKAWFKHHFKAKWQQYLVILLAFSLAGILATEIEHLIRSVIFQSEAYEPFSSGKMYLYNAVISSVLGFAFFLNKQLLPVSDTAITDEGTGGASITEQLISSIPVKQGENILLIPIKEVVYFEAFDNYSFVYDLKGDKKLCDYSLGFLEKRLGMEFSRVHRKYIVNSNHIKQIKPHLNGRYLILFSQAALPTVTSSKSYSPTIRKLIKID
ncbi:MAG: LytTR family DNA-binding domain-containing protein [Bacteroidota bacterium]